MSLFCLFSSLNAYPLVFPRFKVMCKAERSFFEHCWTSQVSADYTNNLVGHLRSNVRIEFTRCQVKSYPSYPASSLPRSPHADSHRCAGCLQQEQS